MKLHGKIYRLDDRREIIVPGDKDKTIEYCVQDFIRIAQEAISMRGSFYVALSGGNTPQVIFQHLANRNNIHKIAWDKTFIFWSDERNVPPTHPDSNYHNAMESGLSSLPIQRDHIFRMQAEDQIEKQALAYEGLIKSNVPHNNFDLIMLGMGDDGHTASLFPHTEGLKENERLVIANHIPQKNTWRMTFTFKQIHSTRHLRVYVIGEKKDGILLNVLTSHNEPEKYPAQLIGTPTTRALWIADTHAAKLLADRIPNLI